MKHEGCFVRVGENERAAVEFQINETKEVFAHLEGEKLANRLSSTPEGRMLKELMNRAEKLLRIIKEEELI